MNQLEYGEAMLVMRALCNKELDQDLILRKNLLKTRYKVAKSSLIVGVQITLYQRSWLISFNY